MTATIMTREPELTLKDEEIIRGEAKLFYDMQIRNADTFSVSKYFHKIKVRMSDFYSSESKSVFLDEMENQVSENLTQHRDQSHGGNPSPDCDIEIAAERMLYYIRQEMRTLPLIANQRFKSQDENNRTKVFISYSHFDKEVLGEIQRHFKPLRATIDLWDDERIDGGKKWKEEIRKAIAETKVAILLVSTDFLGSEFIASEELPPLLEAAEKEGAVILPIILDDCLFDQFKELNVYQALNPPSKPLNQMDIYEKDRLFVNMVRQTKRILDNEAIAS